RPSGGLTTDPIRIVTVTAMGAVIALIACGIFDRVVPTLLLPPVLVGTSVLVARRLGRAWRAAVVGATAVASAIVVALLVDGGPRDAVEAVAFGPRRILSTEWPSPVEPSIVVAVGLFVALATAASGALAELTRWRFLPLVPLAVATTVVLSLGAPQRPTWWSVALLGLGALVVGALPPGVDLRGRVTTVTGDRTVAATLAAVAAVAAAVTGLVTSDVRADPRQVEDADTAASILDPIEATAALRRADPPIELFEITDRSAPTGRALPIRWRLVALDEYDGQRWVPAVTLRPIGERLGIAPAPALGVLPPITFEVEYRTDDFDLVPFPGRPLSIDVPVETDVARVAVRLPETPQPGTTVTATSMIAPTAATLAATARVGRRPVDEFAQLFADEAREIAGDGSVLDQLRAIETTMRTEWVLDRDVAGGGQQLALLERFVTETRRGTREQFVTTFVLFARALGVDARVATGFVLPPASTTSPSTIRSGDAAAWPEVRIVLDQATLDDELDDEATADATAGWLAFDPVPPQPEAVEDEPPDPPEAQSPAAAQPPIQPPSDEDEDEDEPVAELRPERSRWGTIVLWIARVGAVVTIGLLPILVVVGTILGAKWWRRRRRLRHPDPEHRVRGAWANVSDALVDAGLSIGPAWTDDRIARGGAQLAPSVPHELRRVAAMETAVTFGFRDDAWRLVDDAASTSRSIEAALRGERTRWQRIRWRLSLRSLRRSTRSPVVP
ncbi:MAG: transglutaminase-like domain-containing protein, partial [Acidimicrobiia bacterium]